MGTMKLNRPSDMNATKKASWNPHYLAYCRTHGRTPEKQMAHDEQVWIGGVMCGFILWIDQQKRRFYKAHKECFLDPHVISDLSAWAAWLQNEGQTPLSSIPVTC